jgi:hypothetical protein
MRGRPDQMAALELSWAGRHRLEGLVSQPSSVGRLWATSMATSEKKTRSIASVHEAARLRINFFVVSPRATTIHPRFFPLSVACMPVALHSAAGLFQAVHCSMLRFVAHWHGLFWLMVPHWRRRCCGKPSRPCPSLVRATSLRPRVDDTATSWFLDYSFWAVLPFNLVLETVSVGWFFVKYFNDILVCSCAGGVYKGNRSM